MSDLIVSTTYEYQLKPAPALLRIWNGCSARRAGPLMIRYLPTCPCGSYWLQHALRCCYLAEVCMSVYNTRASLGTCWHCTIRLHISNLIYHWSLRRFCRRGISGETLQHKAYRISQVCGRVLGMNMKDFGSAIAEIRPSSSSLVLYPRYTTSFNNKY